MSIAGSTLAELLKRYSNLRFCDIQKLLISKGLNITFEELTQCNEKKPRKQLKSQIATNSTQLPLTHDTTTKTHVNSKTQLKSTSKLHHIPSRLKYLNVNAAYRRRKVLGNSIDEIHQIPLVPPLIPEFSRSRETQTLVEDLQKSSIHNEIEKKLSVNWPIDEHVTRKDEFIDTLKSAIHTDLSRISRPIFVHELADYQLPYMTRLSTLRRILMKCCARNISDEGAIHRIVSNDLQLHRLRSKALAPPELYEPLLAFHGTTRISTDVIERLDQKLHGIDVVLNALEYYGPNYSPMDIVQHLPEHMDTSLLCKNHPFRNMAGFQSSAPIGVSGSFKMGAPQSALSKRLASVRYPTLQCVSQNLPLDPQCNDNENKSNRESTIQAINVLERTSGWRYNKKLKFINTLKEVHGNLAPSVHYRDVLDAAFPLKREKFMTNSLRRKQKKSIWSSWRYLRPLRTIEDRAKLLANKRLAKKGKK